MHDPDERPHHLDCMILSINIDHPTAMAPHLPGPAPTQRLADPQLAYRSDPVGVIDQQGAVLNNGVHHRPPAHPQLVGELREGRALSPTWRHTSTPRSRPW